VTYRYTINDIDVNAIGDWEISYERNAGQIFFRRILRGELTFKGDDYDTIMGMSDCDVLEFKIYCGASLHWEGKFKFPYDLEIDEDSCFMKGEPEVVDEYTCLLTNYETEYKLLLNAGGTAIQLRSCAGALLQNLGNAYPLGVAGGPAASIFTSHLNTIINGSSYMDCDLTLASSFLWRSNFPNGTNYAGAYGTNNYITGAGNRLEHIYLYANSRLRQLWGGSACDGPLHPMTFKEYETLLRDRFNAYWFIDENGDFRVEHIHYFDPDFPESDYQVVNDLTTLVSNNGKLFAYRKNKYSYEVGELYDQEIFTWQHYDGTEGTIAHGADFQGVPIYYGSAVGDKSDCVPGIFKEKDLATPKFWSDIYWAYQLNAAGTPDSINCPGHVLLDVDSATNYVRCEQGAYTGVNNINAHLSTANLQEHYFTYDRIFLTGHMNNGATPPAAETTAFDTAKKHKLQEPIEFTLCCDEDFDPLAFIRTELGDGAVKTAKQKKRSIEIELLY